MVHALLSFVIEAGNGWGFYLLFRQPCPSGAAPSTAGTGPAAEDVLESTLETLERFFRECMTPPPLVSV